MSAALIEDVHLTLAGKPVLKGINLEVGAGEIAAVMGMSGSGKTTLLKCVTGLIKPTSGRILISGTDIVPLPENRLDEVRLRIGLVFQHAALFDSLTVYENVAFGLVHNRKLGSSEIRRIVRQRLAEVGMEGAEDLYPAQLSGGMQKRVGLARALAMEPAILCYDEPTSGLDPVIARTIDDLIVRTRDRTGATAIVVSHDISSILRIADRIAMIADGSIIAYGTPDEIRASDDERVQAFLRAL
ncbi:MAG: ABC transporter ATP-binding protein [Chthonomonadales bacterium]